MCRTNYTFKIHNINAYVGITRFIRELYVVYMNDIYFESELIAVVWYSKKTLSFSINRYRCIDEVFTVKECFDCALIAGVFVYNPEK